LLTAAQYIKGYERLEPDVIKVASPVLRRGRASNRSFLFGDRSILTQFLKAGFVYNHHLNPTKAGTPQGGIISPILANMTLDGIERVIASKYYSGKSWKSRNPKKVNFLRYADDFIVTADSEETAKEIMELIELFLKERGLELSEEL
jgi:RNA-directed DNA polymerase